MIRRMWKVWAGLCVVAIPAFFFMSSAFGSELTERERQRSSTEHATKDFDPYLQTLESLKAHQWSNTDDPRLIMSYCEALLETGAVMPKQIANNAPTLFRFANAYISLLSGDVKRSRQIFAALRAEQSGKALGYVGLLDLARYTGNFTSIGPILDELKQDVAMGLVMPDWVLPYYEATYKLSTGRYDEVAAMIRNTKVQQALGRDMISEFQVPIFLRQNKFSDALAQLEQGGDIQESIIEQADVFAASDGYAASSAFLKQKMDAFPLMRGVAQHYAYHSLEAAHYDYNMSVPLLRILVDWQQKKPFDMPLKLGLANALFDSGDPLKMLRDVEFIKALRSGEDFLAYNLFAAKLSLLSKNLDNYRKFIKKAKQMAPLDPAVLWLSYQEAIRENDYGTAIKELQSLLMVDPYNVYCLIAVAKVYIKLGRKNEAALALKLLDGLNRNLSERQRNEIRDIKKQLAMK